MAGPRDWNPCIADPVRFDCRDCTIGPDVDCKYRTDETLRHERAARLGGSGGLFEDGEERAVEAMSTVRAVLVQQRMALPATALINLLPRQLASAIQAEQVEVLLRRTPGIRETSPGMFGNDDLIRPHLDHHNWPHPEVGISSQAHLPSRTWRPAGGRSQCRSR